MIRYIFRRILSLIPVLFVVSVAIFMIVHLTPGKPAVTILGMDATQEAIDELNERLGLNDPIPVQYVRWAERAVRGDLGPSYFMKDSVSESIRSHFLPTLSLAIFSQIIAIVIAIPIGVIAAVRRGSTLDRVLMAASLLGLAIPSFILSLLLVLLFGVALKWLPIAGYAPLSAGFAKHLQFLVLPAFALGIGQSALLARMTRSAMIDALGAPYIQTARSKGMPFSRIVFRDAFKNALLPIITVIGQSFGALVAGAVVVETIFNIPGLGQLMINSLSRRDFAMIQGIVLVVSIVYVGVNLLVDILYGVIDPRIGLADGEGGKA